MRGRKVTSVIHLSERAGKLVINGVGPALRRRIPVGHPGYTGKYAITKPART
jgi:hypothetical protein